MNKQETYETICRIEYLVEETCTNLAKWVPERYYMRAVSDPHYEILRNLDRLRKLSESLVREEAKESQQPFIPIDPYDWNERSMKEAYPLVRMPVRHEHNRVGGLATIEDLP